MPRLGVRAHPAARRTAVRRYDAGVLDLDLAAPPTDNRANDELIRFLADELGIAKVRVRLLRGHAAKQKLLEIDVAVEVLQEWLGRWEPTARPTPSEGFAREGSERRSRRSG
jgi:uncharacterized protein YggU (UPF0235/DUF167 family)